LSRKNYSEDLTFRKEKLVKTILRKVSLLAITVLTAASLNASSIIMGNRNNAAKVNNQKVTKNRELRGVWVASVSNIDWPSKKGLSVEQQKKEFLTILDNVKKWNMNAVFVQIKLSKKIIGIIMPEKAFPYFQKVVEKYTKLKI